MALKIFRKVSFEIKCRLSVDFAFTNKVLINVLGKTFHQVKFMKEFLGNNS